MVESDEPEDANNFPLLIAAVRAALDAAFPDEHKLLCVAVPAGQNDIDLFSFNTTNVINRTSTNAKIIDEAVDFWNLMSYDAVNSRDQQSSSHAGEAVCRRMVDTYAGSALIRRK